MVGRYSKAIARSLFKRIEIANNFLIKTIRHAVNATRAMLLLMAGARRQILSAKLLTAVTENVQTAIKGTFSYRENAKNIKQSLFP